MPLSCAHSKRSGRASEATRLSTPTLLARASCSSATPVSASSRNATRAPGRAWPARYRRADGGAVRAAARDRSTRGSTSTAGCSGRSTPSSPCRTRAAPGPRPGGRLRARWRGCMAVAGRRRLRRADRRPVRRFQSRRPGLGGPALRPGPASRRRHMRPWIATMRRMMRAGIGVRIDHVMGCSGSGGCRSDRAIRRRAPTCATRRASCSTSSRSRAFGQDVGSSARTSAPSNPAFAPSCAGAVCSPTGWPGSRRNRRSNTRPRRLRP